MARRTVHRKCSAGVPRFHTYSDTRSSAKEISKRSQQIVAERKNVMNTLRITHTSGMQNGGNSTHAAKPFCRPEKFKNAARLQNGFTAAPERKALLWLPAHMPPSINSDHLTLLGFLAR